MWGYYYDPVVKANYTFMVPGRRRAPGSWRSSSPAWRVCAVWRPITWSLARLHRRAHSFIIARILPQESELVSADLVLMTADDFRAFFDYPVGHFTDIALRVANPLEVRNVAAKLAERFPDSRPILREEILRTYESIFDWREGIVLVLLPRPAGFCHSGVGEGVRAGGRRKTRDRHPQGDRLGNRRRDPHEVLGVGR